MLDTVPVIIVGLRKTSLMSTRRCISSTVRVDDCI